MSTVLEKAIRDEVSKLPDDQQQKVLEFVAELTSNMASGEPLGSSASGHLRKEVDLRDYGISRKQAAELRASFATFSDWNGPEMEIYNDYDQALAILKDKT